LLFGAYLWFHHYHHFVPPTHDLFCFLILMVTFFEILSTPIRSCAKGFPRRLARAEVQEAQCSVRLLRTPDDFRSGMWLQAMGHLVQKSQSAQGLRKEVREPFRNALGGHHLRR